METHKPNQIEIVVLTTSWLLFSILIGLVFGFDQLEASTTMTASTALLKSLEVGALFFVTGLPISGILYSLSNRRK